MFRKNRSLLKVMVLFLLLVISSVVGYAFLLRINFIDALYMTVITISTVGYKEVAEMSPAAKIFSIYVILAGLGLAGYTVTSIVTFLTEGELKKAWRKRRMESRIADLENHYIVCGAGETGLNAIEQFKSHKSPFVVVDMREDKVRELQDQGILALVGDPTHESVLMQANITKAEGLISAMPTDAENIYTVLTARYLKKDLFIVSRAIEQHAHDKLCMAGADRTVSPNEIGGRRMAAMVLRPTVFSFLDIVTYAGDDVLNLEEVTLGAGSELVSLKLKDTRIPERTGLLVMAIKKRLSDKMVFNPSSEEILELGDTMIVLGSNEKVDLLKDIANDKVGRISV